MRTLLVLLAGGWIAIDTTAPPASHSLVNPRLTPVILPTIREFHFPSKEEVVAAAGLHPLKDTPLTSGRRELRIWFGGGLGWPQDLFRLQIENGNVNGQWIRYWSLVVEKDEPPEAADFPSIIRYDLAGRCDAIRSLDRTAVCIARFTRRPDWGALLAKIESEGVWTLPDEKDLPKEHLANGMQVIVSDGYYMTVEARDGSHYRSYGYGNPETSKQDAAKHAAAISAAFSIIGKSIPPNKHTRLFRGRYTPAHPYSRFVNCGDTTTWGLTLPDSTPLAPRNPANDSLSDTTRSAYVEVRGMKAYRGLARSWGMPYPEIIEGDSILVLRPWRSEECH